MAAVGSYLDARSRGGRWLVRMEDLDAPRIVPGAADQILRTLEAFGLTWDGPVEYQSRRTELYRAALEHLRAQGLTFECSCSRRELSEQPVSAYPGTCRSGPQRRGPTATRFRVDDATVIRWEDAVQGSCCFPLRELGDVVIRRRDDVLAYQLAVVVDDAAQGVSDIIRGADLLDSTAWQIALQRALQLPTPRYGHLPVVVEPQGEKLAKSRRSVPLDPSRAAAQLSVALGLLRHDPGPEIRRAGVGALLEWGRLSWNLDRFHLTRQVAAPA